MKNLTYEQKKIFIISTVGIVILLIYFLFFYLPTSRDVDALKSELAGIENSIRAIEDIAKKGNTIDEKMKILEERSTKVFFKFPEREENELKMISDIAQDLSLEVSSVSVGKQKRLYSSKKLGGNVEIDGKNVYYFTVSIKLSGRYKDFAEYIKTLRELLPSFGSASNISITKSNESGKLNVSFILNLFLLS